jgi:hypothetical protein
MVPVPIALVLVQLDHARSFRLQPASAHVTVMAVGSKLGDVQSAYTSMLLSTLVAEPDADATGVGAGDAVAADVGLGAPDEGAATRALCPD